MADSTARTDSFIALVLQVTGRVRPSDLTGMASEDAAAALQSFAAAHPELGVRMDGESLVEAAVTPAPAPTAPQTPAPEIPAHEMQYTAATPVPEPSAELPDWVYEQVGEAAVAAPYGAAQSVEPEAVPVASSMGEYGAPAEVEFGAAPVPAAVGEYGAPTVDFPAPEQGADGFFPEVAPSQDPAGADGFAPAPAPAVETAANPATDQSLGADDSYGEMPDAGPTMSEPGPAWYWWLIAFIFAPWGGVVAFFVLRATMPKGATRLLIFSLAITALAIMAGVGMGLLAGFSVFGG